MVFRKVHFFFLLIIVVLVASASYVVLFSKTFLHRVNIPYGMLKTGEQLYNPSNLVKWYMPFAQMDIHSSGSIKNPVSYGKYYLEIIDQSLTSIVINTGSGTARKKFIFHTVPDPATGAGSTITLSYTNTLFNEWFRKNELVENAKQSLTNLKDYMEDTKRLYGFDIRVTTVEDTAFLFISETVRVTDKRAATKKLFERLLAYADKKNAGYNGTRIYYSQKSGDEIAIFASIGISNFIEIDPGEPFEYKRMPYGKKLLETSFQGPFGNAHKAYEALEAFKKDHQLVSMAIPFQKFMSDGYDFPDSQVVQMKVYYPIF